ncbi:MAG: 5-formyltetrahydrofolate cyclo-ligase [Oscillospiraceae bacterium]
MKQFAKGLPDLEKSALRAVMRSRIAAMEADVCKKSDQEIFLKILELPEYHAAETLFAYASVRKEVATSEILRHAAAQGKRIALPIVESRTGQMVFASVSDQSDLIEGAFGIPEPKRSCPLLSPDSKTLVFVPALCYDWAGVRLGQGGGYYDRWLAQTNPHTIGLCRELFLQDCLPCLPHDIRVDCVVTEKRVLRLPKKPQSKGVF